MPFSWTVLAELSSHISRKNAIIAVMKSAYASFHAPPWCPAFFGAERLTTIARSLSLLISAAPPASALLRFHAPHVLFELRERRALGREQHLAVEFDCDRGRIAVHARYNPD